MQEEFEDAEGIIRIRKSKNRQHNGQKKRDKRTNNDLQNTTQKTNDRVTRTPLKIGGELRCYGRVGRSCSTIGTHRVLSFIHLWQFEHAEARCTNTKL